MRHGPAEDRARSGRDFDRALTPQGREVVGRGAGALHDARRSLAGRRWQVIASPFRRARETAEIVASSTSPALSLAFDDDLAPDASLPLSLVRDLAEKGVDTLLVGHLPNIEALAHELLLPAQPLLPGGFRAGLIVVLEGVAPAGWRAVAVLDPYRVGP